MSFFEKINRKSLCRISALFLAAMFLILPAQDIQAATTRYRVKNNLVTVNEGTATYNGKKYPYKVIRCVPANTNSEFYSCTASVTKKHSSATQAGKLNALKVVGTTLVDSAVSSTTVGKTLSVYNILTDVLSGFDSTTKVSGVKQVTSANFAEQWVWVYVKTSGGWMLGYRGSSVTTNVNSTLYGCCDGKAFSENYSTSRIIGSSSYSLPKAIKGATTMNMVDNMTKKVTVYSLNNQKAFTENFGAKNYSASGYFDPDF